MFSSMIKRYEDIHEFSVETIEVSVEIAWARSIFWLYMCIVSLFSAKWVNISWHFGYISLTRALPMGHHRLMASNQM